MIRFWGYNSVFLDLIQNLSRTLVLGFIWRIPQIEFLKALRHQQYTNWYNNRTILIVWQGTSCQGLRKWRGELENPKSIISFHKWNHEVTNDVLVKIDNSSQISWEVATNKLASFRSISKFLSEIVKIDCAPEKVIDFAVQRREESECHLKHGRAQPRTHWSRVANASGTSWIFDHG